jgi:hypothetical protein
MIGFYRYYVAYRRVGLGRVDALRFAWLVASASARPTPIRIAAKRHNG